MTTIDSDSESQDSDDGRRFRFEATRKDDTLRLHSNNRRRSPLSKSSKYRSRSGDRNNHNRRDYDRTKQDRDRKEGVDRSDKRKVSKERESRDNNKSNRHATKGSVKDATTDAKNAKESLRNSSNSKDHKSSKDSRSRESKTSNARVAKDAKKEPRDQESKTKTSENKESRDRDRGIKRSRDSSHDRLSATKHGHRSREKYDRSRERSNNRDKGKQLDNDKSKEERNKNIISTKKSPGKQSESKKIVVKREAHSPSKILDQIGSDSESDLGALDPDVGPVMALDTFEDCREMNLSDFDIISDTEGSSPETREEKSSSKEGIKVKGEILAPHYYGPKITKRVSRRQYERLVRRQAALNSRRLEEFYKVNRRGEDNTTPPLDPSCNNPSDVSDFLLGTEASVKAVGERRRSRKIEEDSGEEEEYKEDKNRDSRNVDQLKIDKINLNCEIYGPSLPPKSNKEHTVVKNSNKDVGDASSSRLRTDESVKNSPVEASLPQVVSRPVIIGPSLPPGIVLNSTSQDEIAKNGAAETESVPIIGPSLPPHLRQDKSNSVSPEEQDSTKRSVFGPTLPPNFVPKDNSDSDSEDGVLGPMPADHPAAMQDYIQRQLEDRARRMKNKLDGKNLVVEQREEWMIELPSAQAANLGLGSKRQFRARAGPDMSDRSSWTDTPADKAKKREDKLSGKVKIVDPATESERLAIHQRDKAMEKMAEKHTSKKRKESLVDMHKKKLHKKKKKEEKEAKEAGKPARRPFDRDVDMQVNKFDEAQKKSILKKAQLLNDRFSRGESKYL